MKFFMDPTFWTLVAFLFCLVIFGRRVFFLISDHLNGRVQRIEHHLEEARILNQEAQNLFHRRVQEAKDVENHLLEIAEKLEKEIKFLWKEADKKIQLIMEIKEGQFLKRMKILEDQTSLQLKQKLSNCIYKILIHLLKDLGAESQAFLVNDGISYFSKQLLKA